MTETPELTHESAPSFWLPSDPVGIKWARARRRRFERRSRSISQHMALSDLRRLLIYRYQYEMPSDDGFAAINHFPELLFRQFVPRQFEGALVKNGDLLLHSVLYNAVSHAFPG